MKHLSPAQIKALRETAERLGLALAREAQGKSGWVDEHGVRQGGLIAFVRYFWSVLEPETEFVDGWPLWAMVQHLEAVTSGAVNRLLLNVPPGSMKSLLTDVFWPAWEWGPMHKAHLRYVSFSYSADLTERNNRFFRDLITSERYLALYPHVQVRNKTTIRVDNSARGWKLASSVGGVGTGMRGDRVILDDPNNVKEAESKIVRDETNRWFRESMSNRLNDLKDGAIIIIMQRVHEDDVSGLILSLELDYCHLSIPMEYEPREAIGNGIGWVDPRIERDEIGELAWPERFPAEVIEATKRELGPYAYAGQYQQRPEPRGGGIFKREWWQVWDPADGKWPAFSYIFASLDAAVTRREENCPSALTVWGMFELPDAPGRSGVMLIDAWRKFLQMHGAEQERLEHEVVKFGDTPNVARARNKAWRDRVGGDWGLVEWVAWTCRQHKVDRLLIESEKGGIVVGDELRRLYGREQWEVQMVVVKGDKVSRALAVQPIFAQGVVYAPVHLDWAAMVVDEMAVFPKGRYRDLTDSATQAMKHVREHDLAQFAAEHKAAELDRMMYKGRQPKGPVEFIFGID